MPPLFITLILTTALLLVVVVARRNGSVRGALARDVRPRGERGPSPAQLDAERRLRPRIAAPLAGEDAPTDPPEGGASGPVPVASDTDERQAGGQDTVVWSWPEAGAVIDAPGWPAPGELGAADEPRAEGEDAAEPAVAYQAAVAEDEEAVAEEEALDVSWDLPATEPQADGFDPATGWAEPEWQWDADEPGPTASEREDDTVGADTVVVAEAAEPFEDPAVEGELPAWSAVSWEPAVAAEAGGGDDEDWHTAAPVVAVEEPPYEPFLAVAPAAPPAPPVVVEIELGGEPIRLMIDPAPGATRAWVLSGDAELATGDGHVTIRPLPAEDRSAQPPAADRPGRAQEHTAPGAPPLPAGLLAAVEDELRASALSLLLADQARAEAERRLAELAARLAAGAQAV